MTAYGINGFGRIGRGVLRAMVQEEVEQIAVINDLADSATLAHLLKWDSVHGRFDGEVSHDAQHLFVRGHKIRLLSQSDPASLRWNKFGVDVVLESTGAFTQRGKAELHLTRGGATRVLISASVADPDATICAGVNEDTYDGAIHFVVSNASCSTRCLSVMAKVLDAEFGIVSGFVSTVHSYTNGQSLLDSPQRVQGGAFRVPTADGSLIDLSATFESDVTVEAINNAFEKAASTERLAGILEYSDDPLVSADIIHNAHSCIFDSGLTMVHEPRFLKIVGWYDNEWGYSNRCVEMLRLLEADQRGSNGTRIR